MPDYYGKYSGESIDSILEDSELRTYRKQEVNDLLADKVSAPSKAVQEFVSVYGAHYMKDYAAATVSNYTTIIAAARAAISSNTLFSVPWAQQGEMCLVWFNANDYMCFEHNNMTYICTPTGYAYESSITIDNELSLDSTNPVQNKVITAALNEKVGADTSNLVNYLLKGNTGATLDKSYVNNTNTFSVFLKNSEDTVISTIQLELPIADTVEALILGNNGVLTLKHHTSQDTTLDLKPLINGLVPDTRTIAGLDLKTDINAVDLGNAIGLDNKVDKVNGKGLSSNDFTDTLKTKLNNIEDGATKTIVESQFLTASTNPVESATIKAALDLKADASALSAYSLITATGKTIALEMNNTTYELVAKLYNANGTLLSTSSTINLPIEEMIVDIDYYDVDPLDPTHKNFLRFTLKSGTTTDVPVEGIVAGLVPDTRTIAGLNLKTDITTAQLSTELGIPTIQNDIASLQNNKLEDKVLVYDGTNIKDDSTVLSFSAIYAMCTTNKYRLLVSYSNAYYPLQIVKSTQIVFTTTISDQTSKRISCISIANDNTVLLDESVLLSNVRVGDVLTAATTTPSGSERPSGPGISVLDYCSYDSTHQKLKLNYLSTTTSNSGLFSTT